MTANHMRLHGLRMADAGYSLVPIAAGQKWPGEYQDGKWWHLKGWEFLALTPAPLPLVENVWSNYPGCGVGIACGGHSRVIGVDIDILDAEISGNIRRMIEEKLGTTPLVRVGKAPKVLLVYRTTEKMEKLSFQPIEVLASGQQFVAYGVHPDTGLSYTWPIEAPDDTIVDSLPLVTPQQVKEAVEAAYATIPEELKPKRLSSAPVDGERASSSETASATPEAIREALAHIPNPDIPWDEWKRVLMATYASSGGDEGAYFEFLTWSRRSTKHDDGSARREWTGCRSSPPRSVGFGTLHYLATQNGWVPSAGLVFNTAKDVSDVDISGFDAWPLAEPAQPSIPITLEIQRVTVQEKFVVPPGGDQAVSLASVELAPLEAIESSTNEMIAQIVPPIEPINFVTERIVVEHIQVASDVITTLSPVEAPSGFQLTDEEIEHGTLPKEFIDQFPQEWLYTSSLIGQMAAWVESACPISHRVFALMASFTAFASLVGRQYKTASDLRPNLACIIIAGTGSGKEGPRNAITKLFLAADAARYIGPRGGFSSGSGVIEGIRNQPNMWLAVDEFGKKIAAYGSGKVDQNQREMIAMFLEALANDYVGGKGYANSIENPVKIAVTPNLNIFGSSQVEEMVSALSSAASADGLIQRFLFVPTFAEYVPMKQNFEKPPLPDSLVNGFKWMINHLATLGGEFATNDDPTMEPNQRIVAMTQQAHELFSQLDRRRVDMARAGRVMWVRSAAMSLKVAMLEAIARDPLKPVVDAELLDSARRLVDWFTLYAERVVRERIADNYEEQTLIKIRQIIQVAGPEGIPHSELLRRVQSIGKARLKEVIERLQESEELEVRYVKSPRGPAGAVYVATNVTR